MRSTALLAKTKKFLSSAAILGAAFVAATSAHAQAPGQYTGKDSDGFDVTLNVYQGKKGTPLLTLVRAVGFFYCDGKELLTLGQPVPYGGAILLHVPFKNGTAEFAGTSNDLSALTGTVAVDGTGLSGSLEVYAALFSGKASPPDNAVARSCKTRHLTFTAQPSNG